MIGALLERHPRFANRLYGFTPPEHGTMVLVHRRVYIVPARLGWLFAATLGILLIGSINYALSLGFALTFLLAGLGLAGMVHTARNLARMAISVGRAEPVFAGEAAQFRLYLDGGPGFDRPAILARHLAAGSQLVVDVPAGGRRLPARMGPEQRLSRLAGWVLAAERTGAHYGLRLPGLEIAPRRGDSHSAACLQALALYQPS